MERLYITDVCMRDGLQNQCAQVSTEAKLALAQHLVAAGVASVEATSFVSPKAVPQMADAADVVLGLQQRLPTLRTSVLVPNLKGLRRALQAGCREVAVVLSATEEMNRRNINMSLTQAREESALVLREARASGIKTRAYIAVAFDCPFEGATPLDRVKVLAAEMYAAGADEVVIADTIGSAFPAEVRRRMTELATVVPLDRLSIHLHDTRGMGVANAWAAIEAGVRRFDASAGGIGGCPFAPGAAGNLATEDLVLLAENSGFDTGINPVALVSAIEFAESLLGRPLGGHSARWLIRQRERAAQTSTEGIARLNVQNSTNSVSST
ncbi:hydroxymethylglutaryl-CoA lyase [Pseudomonas fluorescens]|uniref:Hydroxymethylglutaryl-CoA lyase YngG n=1 Tax=Pseudomonas fluorescens TaxID=294 RepID=A0A5E7P2R2_PSEFL|nr:hydroxymethylglutaryl-CoA lyase [Pseudomonas fluorescens]VVP43974.1 Hydroxymethylglutaryl-CoA lyase YngG [Pseudomonas fluorescens]